MTDDVDRETAATESSGASETQNSEDERPGNADELEGPKKSQATPSQSSASDWTRAKPQGPEIKVHESAGKERDEKDGLPPFHESREALQEIVEETEDNHGRHET